MSTATEVDPAVRPESKPAVDAEWVRPAALVAVVRRHSRLLGLLVFAALSFLWFARTWIDPVQRHAGLPGVARQVETAAEAWERALPQVAGAPVFILVLDGLPLPVAADFGSSMARREDA